MKKEFVKTWNKSIQPRKQRKFVAKAPYHLKGAQLNVHLSKELREKYQTRSIRVRKGDKVRIMRGQFIKIEGKVEEVNATKSKLYVAKVELPKKDGSKARYPINPSNVMIIELVDDDKKRFKQKAAKVKK